MFNLEGQIYIIMYLLIPNLGTFQKLTIMWNTTLINKVFEWKLSSWGIWTFNHFIDSDEFGYTLYNAVRTGTQRMKY